MKTALAVALLSISASVQTMAQAVAPPATAPAGLTGPARPADGPGAPHRTVMGAGMNARADRNGDFEIGAGPPDHLRMTP